MDLAGAIVAAFTVVTGLATVSLATVVAARAAVRATLYERYVSRWESQIMIRRRARLATTLTQRRDTTPEPAVPMERDIESVVGFFDELGLFLRKSMVDDDFVWRMFLEPAMHYWFLCGEEYVKKRSVEYPYLYQDYKYLTSRMKEISPKAKFRRFGIPKTR
jgi:hypothetical protein